MRIDFRRVSTQASDAYGSLAFFLFDEYRKRGFLQKLTAIGFQAQKVVVQRAGIARAAITRSKGAGVIRKLALEETNYIRQPDFFRRTRQPVTTTWTRHAPSQAGGCRLAQQFRC